MAEGPLFSFAFPLRADPPPPTRRIDISLTHFMYNPPIRGAAMQTLLRPTRFTRLSYIYLVVALALLSCSPALPAQLGNAGSDPGWPLHDSSPVHASADGIGAAGMPLLIEPDESCLIWTLGKHKSATVSAANLKAPQAARDEYKKACTELKTKRLDTAEAHLRKAVDLDPAYPGAWALLGQVLEARNQIPEAKSACSQASTADVAYAPAYLCLSELAAQQNDWHNSLNFADRALALDPIQNAYGHFYTAVAQVHLGSLAQAQSNLQDTISADHDHHIPQAHLLLAQIYGNQNELTRAADELRAYIKAAPPRRRHPPPSANPSPPSNPNSPNNSPRHLAPIPQ